MWWAQHPLLGDGEPWAARQGQERTGATHGRAPGLQVRGCLPRAEKARRAATAPVTGTGRWPPTRQARRISKNAETAFTQHQSRLPGKKGSTWLNTGGSTGLRPTTHSVFRWFTHAEPSDSLATPSPGATGPSATRVGLRCVLTTSPSPSRHFSEVAGHSGTEREGTQCMANSDFTFLVS